MPGFDLENFPFVISYGNPMFNLINVKTASSDILVNGVPSEYFPGQQAVAFISDSKEGDKQYPYPINMHFASSFMTEDGKRLENWHCF